MGRDRRQRITEPETVWQEQVHRCLAKRLHPVLVRVQRLADQRFGRWDVHVTGTQGRSRKPPAPLFDVVRERQEVGRVILLRQLVAPGTLESENVVGVIQVRKEREILVQRARNEAVDRPNGPLLRRKGFCHESDQDQTERKRGQPARGPTSRKGMSSCYDERNRTP